MSLDICMYISDQHSYSLQSNAGNKIVRTPNLDYIASQGVTFNYDFPNQ